MADTVIIEKHGKIGILTLNRPQKLNALNDDLLVDLHEGIRQLDEDEDVRVIVKNRSLPASRDTAWAGDVTWQSRAIL